jgi:hypothetical protein
VLIQIEYRIDPANRDAFLRAVRAIGPVRRRNGANSWRVFRDLAEEGLFVERYIISSWAEYVRLRSRMTIADRHVQQESRSTSAKACRCACRGSSASTARRRAHRVTKYGATREQRFILAAAWPRWSAHTSTLARARWRELLALASPVGTAPCRRSRRSSVRRAAC